MYEELIDRAGLSTVHRKVVEGVRLDQGDGERLYGCADLPVLGYLANLVRDRDHGDRTYYVRNQHINYTNVCNKLCRFCSFYVKPKDELGYVLSPEQVQARVREYMGAPITEIHMVGGVNPKLPYEYYLDLLRAMKEARPEGPYLVVCPAAVKTNWAREIEIVLPAAEIAVVGPEPTPEPGYAGWVVINYDILAKHPLQAHAWRGLVFDEAHYLKNYRSQRHRLSMELVKAVDDEAVVHLLTGTPLTSRPRDLFPLLQLARHALGRSFTSFARRYCDGYQNDYGWVADGASNIEELTVQLHGIMLRRTKAEVLDLPPKLRSWLEVEIASNVARQISEAVLELLQTISRNRLAIAKVRSTIPFVENAIE